MGRHQDRHGAYHDAGQVQLWIRRLLFISGMNNVDYRCHHQRMNRDVEDADYAAHQNLTKHVKSPAPSQHASRGDCDIDTAAP